MAIFIATACWFVSSRVGETQVVVGVQAVIFRMGLFPLTKCYPADRSMASAVVESLKQIYGEM